MFSHPVTTAAMMDHQCYEAHGRRTTELFIDMARKTQVRLTAVKPVHQLVFAPVTCSCTNITWWKSCCECCSHTCAMWVQKKFEIIFAKGRGTETAAVCPIKQIQYLNEIGTYNQYWSREKSNNNLLAHWKRPSFVNLLVMLQSHLFFFPSSLLKILRMT